MDSPYIKAGLQAEEGTWTHDKNGRTARARGLDEASHPDDQHGPMRSPPARAPVEPFACPADHVLAEIGRIDLLIRIHVALMRQTAPQDDRYRGLYISDDEIDALMEDGSGMPLWALATLPPRAEAALAHVSQMVAERSAETKARGGVSRFSDLERLFALSARDTDILLVCIAAELDTKYERIFGYLHDDVTKRRPSIDLVLNILSAGFAEKMAGRARFETGSPLRRHRLVEVFDDPANPSPSLLGRCLKIDHRILGFLLGSDDIDHRLRFCASRLDPDTNRLASVVAHGLDDFLMKAAHRHRAEGVLLLHLHGRDGVGKKTWAEALCVRLKTRLLVLDAAAMAAMTIESFDDLLAVAIREARLDRAVLYWKNSDSLLQDERRPHIDLLLASIRASDCLTILASRAPWSLQGAEPPDLVSVQIPPPTGAQRRKIWENVLGNAASAAVRTEIPALASKFQFTPGEIVSAAAAARACAGWQSAENPVLTLAELYNSCRKRSHSNLDRLGRKIRPRATWNDLVLSADALQQLREVCNRAQCRPEVMEEWRFGEKLSLGKGLSALFAGPSGTGKTMAAEVLAAELQLDLYKIDLSLVVSKYIGDTEKNLARVFGEAESANAILFFDEADALFGKRSEVKDAHDRYANVETSYLLQRMEEYEGISILATNLRRNMDEAFTRRIAFIVQFPPPEADERLRIWQKMFPGCVPLNADVDLSYMSRQFKFSGGSIRNVAIAAAYLAASSGAEVAMSHLLRATRRELQKQGKSVVRSEFGALAHLVED